MALGLSPTQPAPRLGHAVLSLAFLGPHAAELTVIRGCETVATGWLWLGGPPASRVIPHVCERGRLIPYVPVGRLNLRGDASQMLNWFALNHASLLPEPQANVWPARHAVLQLVTCLAVISVRFFQMRAGATNLATLRDSLLA